MDLSIEEKIKSIEEKFEAAILAKKLEKEKVESFIDSFINKEESE